MNLLKLARMQIISLILVITTLTSNAKIIANTEVQSNPIKVAVIFNNFSDVYISLIRENLVEIQNNNRDKVELTFYDSKSNQQIENENLRFAINNKFDLIIANLIDLAPEAIKFVIDQVKPKNIPIIFFNTIPPSLTPIKSYSKAIIIATDAEQSGILEGNIIVNEWNKNKEIIDKNNDNKLQYIMLMGPKNHPATVDRTKYSIFTIKSAGIETQELASRTADWDKDLAKTIMDSLFPAYRNRLEAIISNNDAMAIGAIQVLQSYGYNKGDKNKTIPVVGVDAIPEARKLVDEGYMTGTVAQDPKETAEALYKVGLNLAYNKPPLKDTNYSFDESGVIIKLPFHAYLK